MDGTVVASDQASAVKFFVDRSRYAREAEIYQVLLREEILSILDHAIPILIRNDDELLAIEMTIVREQRP